VTVKVGVPASARIAVALLGLAATFTALAWAWTGGGGLRLAAPLATLALVLHLLVELHATPTRRLRWDGAGWWLKPDRPGVDEVPGELTIALDLGAVLLLRFAGAAGPQGGGHGVWLPLQRGTVEGDWHALRCALYSPRLRAPLAPSEAIDA